MSSMTLDVPTEIIERIIDMLYDDLLSLKACSLVCRKWFTRARFDLFIDFNLRLGSWSLSLDESGLDAEIATFQQSSLPFSVIERLRLNGAGTDRELGVLRWPCWHQSRNITELHLYRLENLDNDLPPFVANLPHLRSLYIAQTHFASTISILNIIAIAPQLAELELLYVTWETFERQMDGPVPHQIPLRHLILNQAHNLNAFTNLLLAAYPNLTLWSLWTHNLESDRALMNRCRASLRTLDLRHHDATSFNLTTYESLCTLILPFGHYDRGFLTSIKSASFSYLVLLLTSRQPDKIIERNLKRFDWASIDSEMAEFHPSASILLVGKELNAKVLRRLGFDLAERMGKFLPRCAEKGMVKVYPSEARIWRDLHVYLR